MSNIGSYKNTKFNERQKFLVLDPATGATSLVLGSSLVEYITPQLNYIRSERTRTSAAGRDYPIGTLVETAGALEPGDDLASTYLVVEGGTGDFPMANGNDLLVIKGDDLFRERLEAEFDADQAERANEFNADQSDREQRFHDFLLSSGYQGTGTNGAVEDYAAGIEFTEYNQILRDGAGEFWRVSGSTELPYTTTGAGLPEGGNFVSVGDAALRQELGDGVIRATSLSNLKSYTGRSPSDVAYMACRATRGDGGAGEFVWHPEDMSAEVASDPFEGIYVAPTSDPSGAGGAWVRSYLDAVSVTWFGAVGDGVTENQEMPINAAIAVHQNVYIPSGVYMLSSWVSPLSGTTIFGERDSVLKNTPDFYGTYWGAIRINGDDIRDVVIKGITLDGNRSNLGNYNSDTDLNTENTSTPLIRIQGTGTSKYPADIKITDVHFVNSALDSVYIRAPYIKGVSVSGCYSYNCGRTHFVVTEGEDIVFDGNICYEAKNSLFDIETNTSDAVVRNVTLSNNLLMSTSVVASGIGLTGPGTHENVIISGNIIQTANKIMSFGNCSNLVFSENVCSGVNRVDGRGVIETLGGAKNTVFSNNTIKTTGDLAAGETARGLWIRSPESIVFSNNIFDFWEGSLAIDQGGFGAKIIGNKITSATTPLNIDAISGVSVSGNEIVSLGSSGVGLNLVGSDLIFSGNTVDLGGTIFQMYANDATYHGNSITGVATARVRYVAGSVSIIGNRLTLQKLEIVDPPKILLKDNVISVENRTSGDLVDIQVGTLDADVIGNSIYAEDSSTTTGNGVYIRSARFKFADNSVIDRKATKTVGAALRTSSEALIGVISGNTFETVSDPSVSVSTDFKPYIPEKTTTENLNIFNHVL